jgi:hypothetical protein
MSTFRYESVVHHAYLLVCMAWLGGSSALARTSTAPRMGWARPVSIKLISRTQNPADWPTRIGSARAFAVKRGSAAQLIPHLSSQKLNRLRNALAMDDDLGVR